MDTKKIETVLTTVTIDSKVDSGKIDVVVGESAKMDVVKAVNYIQSGKAEIEAGVTAVLNQVDDHVADKTAEFDQNAQDKTDAFNSNAVNKTGDFNDNYTSKLNAFNQNAQDKTNAFDLNASDKTGDFNTNASDKTTDFNDNYTAKKALIDAEVGIAQTAATNASNSADLSKQWAIGEPSEPSDGSAKYWAEQASQTLPNDGQLDIQVNGSSIATFTANQSGNTTANVVVPDSATWGNITGTLSNQTDLQTALNGKYDASNPNGYITGINSSDITTALGYTPVNPTSLASVATSGLYSDLSGKPNYGAGLSYSSSSLQLLDQNGNNLGSAVTIKSTPDLDGVTIDTNSDDELEAIGTVNKNTAVGATAVKYDWIGTLAEYNSQNVETLHPEWVCYITDDVSGGTSVYTKTEVDNAISTALTTMLDSAFPVGSRYITENSTCPLATLIPNSTWVLTSQGRVIQGADSNHLAGTTAEAGLPNITGSATTIFTGGARTTNGCLSYSNVGSAIWVGSEEANVNTTINFNASDSNSIYGNSTTVQPPAEFVNIFKRTA